MSGQPSMESPAASGGGGVIQSQPALSLLGDSGYKDTQWGRDGWISLLGALNFLFCGAVLGIGPRGLTPRSYILSLFLSVFIWR